MNILCKSLHRLGHGIHAVQVVIGVGRIVIFGVFYVCSVPQSIISEFSVVCVRVNDPLEVAISIISEIEVSRLSELFRC